jgi:predicted DNA-binding transcriptional regulator YafY
MHHSARPPLARVMSIDQAVRAGTWPNARTLAERLEVDPRTVRRDITYMRDQLGAPLEYVAARNGYRYSELTFRLPYLSVTEGELVALLLAQRLVRQFRGTPFEDDLRRAFTKLAAMLPEAVTLQTEAAADCLAVLPVVRTDYDPALFAALARAVVGRRKIEVVYHTADRDATTMRTLDPYRLMLRGDDWYVVAHDDYRGEVRVFAVQRVRSVRETGETFEGADDFRIEDYMGDSFRLVRGDSRHLIVLHFRPPTAGRISEKTWHPSQTIEPATDGGIILKFEVSDLREVKRWVMFWGTDCQVLEPRELRQAVLLECRTVLSRYEGSDAP